MAARRVGRGFSFLEAVASAALLSMLTASVLGGLSAIYAGQARMKHRLACAELANRIILMWLHDPEVTENDIEKILPYPGDGLEGRVSPEGLPLPDAEYRWELIQRRVSPSLPLPADANTRSIDGMTELEVTVWFYDGPDRFGTPGDNPKVTVRRIVTPLEHLDNPDTAENFLGDRDLLRRVADSVISGEVNEGSTRDRRSERDDR